MKIHFQSPLVICARFIYRLLTTSISRILKKTQLIFDSRDVTKNWRGQCLRNRFLLEDVKSLFFLLTNRFLSLPKQEPVPLNMRGKQRRPKKLGLKRDNKF